MNNGSAATSAIRSKYRIHAGIRSGGSCPAARDISEVPEPTVDKPDPQSEPHERARRSERGGRTDQRADAEPDAGAEDHGADQQPPGGGGIRVHRGVGLGSA